MNKKRLVSILAGVMAALLLITLIAGLIPVPAGALTSEKLEELKKQIKELEGQQDQIQDEIDALQDQIDENMGEMERLVAEKSVVEQEVGLLDQQIANVNALITTYSLLIADKQDELDAALANQQALKEKNKERIRAMEEGITISYWSVLLNSNSFAEFLDRMNMVDEIAAADQRRLEEMRRAAEAVAQAQAELETEKDALEQTKLELDEVQTRLNSKLEEVDALLVKLNAKGQEYLDLVHEAEKEEDALIQQIAKTEKEYNKEKDRLEEEERKRREEEERKKREEAEKLHQQQQQQQQQQGSSKPPSNVTAGITWIMPCSYRYLSSPYGWRIHPVYGDRRFHSGVDLAGQGGTNIYASRSGTVTASGYNSGNGYYVTINHGDGFSTSYLHMQKTPNVKVGQYVVAGHVIGYMGSTGVSTGNHLHFTVYYNGSTVNPADYINFY